jgi:Ca2+-binding EF-hand superfamily protein
MKISDVKLIFEQFDEDKSGSLELEELVTMFHDSGISVDRESLKKIFRIFKTRIPNSLFEDEFTNLALSKSASKQLEEFLQHLRKA